jgi:hypothetical protein
VIAPMMAYRLLTLQTPVKVLAEHRTRSGSNGMHKFSTDAPQQKSSKTPTKHPWGNCASRCCNSQNPCHLLMTPMLKLTWRLTSLRRRQGRPRRPHIKPPPSGSHFCDRRADTRTKQSTNLAADTARSGKANRNPDLPAGRSGCIHMIACEQSRHPTCERKQ